ncbi:MAG: RDD family protein [Bacteroidota bacterium]
MKNIDIQTTQNVTIEYELATLQDRFVAMFIDLMVVLGISMILLYGISFLVNGLFDGDESASMALGFVPIITFLGYHLVSEIMVNGQSIGKKAMGIKVVRLDGEEASLSDYLLRSIFHIIDTLFSLGILAALMISSSQRKQRLGDMTANTTVIKLKSTNQFTLTDILKINTTESYEPVYLDVKHFSESDMLLLKDVITRYKKFPNIAHKEALNLAVHRFSELLELPEIPKDKIAFLNTVIKDYVVLTR